LEKNPDVFIKNLNFFLTEERKTWTSFFFKVNYFKKLLIFPFNQETISKAFADV